MAKTPQQIIAYARWSPRPNAEECESTETQFEKIEAWSRVTDQVIAGKYADEDVSGKSLKGRPEVELAIQHACRIKGILVVYSLSRLARNTKEAIEIVERLQRCGADIASLNERIDTSTAMGRFFFVVMAALAQLEREQLSDRTKDAMRRHQKSGRRMTRPDRCPYGYGPAEDGELIRIQDEQTVIALMKAARDSGMSFKAIGKHLDQAGFARRDDGAWAKSPASIRKILKREFSEE